ncbi:MAG TPA: DUF4926 domain-containing protein [Candidatus Hydrogenedentes bacterium]|nr:DUF4926 domain-containing protein [Candidatus Hydrogenedentota bacterium]
MIKEMQSVVLTEDLPEYGLEKGDVGTVVLSHGDAGYEVEFVTLEGETVAVATVSMAQVRGVSQGEIAHARLVASS